MNKALFGVLVLFILAAALNADAHEGGPPKLTLDVDQIGIYVIKSDVESEGDLSFYLAHEGYDKSVVRVTPEGTFSSPGDGRFTIRGLKPGKTTITLGWLYPPNDAGGLFTLEVTVNPPATTPPTSANVVTSAKSNDPVNLFTGELTMMEPPDLDLGGPMPLYFARYYGSGLSREALLHTTLGDNWSSNFDWRLFPEEDLATIVSWEGRRIAFKKSDGKWNLTGRSDIPFQLVESGGLFILGDPRDNRVYTFDEAGLLQTIEDGRGNIHTLTYTGGRLSLVEDGLGRSLRLTSGGFQQLAEVSDGTRSIGFEYTNVFLSGFEDGSFQIFDEYFVLGAVRDALGNVTRYAYDESGTTNHVRALLTSKTRPLGNIPYSQTWNSDGLVASQTESGVNTHSFTYNGLSTTITDPLGRTRIAAHTSTGELAALTDEAGETMTVESNARGQRASVTSRKGGATRLEYHEPSGKVSAMTTPDGITTRWEFAPRTYRGIIFYDPSRIIHHDGSTEEFTYDAAGNVIELIDRAGKVWRMTYNGHGQVLTVTNPIGGRAIFTYNADGTPATRSDSDSPDEARFEHDMFGRMTNLIRADGSTVTTVYDLNDRVTSVTDERGNAYTYRYDENNNLVEMTDPEGASTLYSHDARDRLVQVTDGLGHDTFMAYDELEHLSTIRNRNDHVISMGYDERRRMSTLTNPDGGQWSFEYDAAGVLKTLTNPLEQSQSQETDALGRPIAFTDALGNKKSMTRNHLRQVTSTVDELSRTSTMTHDSRGLLTAVSKPVIGTATYDRNDIGQVTRITDPGGHRWLKEHTPMGRLRLETDPLNRTTEHEYDPRGRLTRTTFPDGSTRETSFDARNNPTSAVFSDGTELQYSHDALNRLTAANDVSLEHDAESRITDTISEGITFGAGYDAGGRIVSASYNNDAFQVVYEYDASDRLTRVSDTLSGAEIAFSYDTAGRMTEMRRANGVDGIYDHDPVGRLTRIQEGELLDLVYSLDAAGQVIGINIDAPLDPADFIAPGDRSFNYDAARQISNAGYGYDERGRMTAAPGATYSYDGASRMIRNGDVMLAYNGLNDLVTRTEDGSTIRYFYNYALGMGPIVAERNESSGDFARFYVWSPAGRLLYSIDAATNKATYHHFDRVGSTLILTDDQGGVTDTYVYSPYGRLLAHEGTSSQPFTYVGRHGVRQEGESLYQMRARYYSPTTGSFLTPDPLPVRLEDIHSLNPYHYVAGDPIRSVDPEGEDRTVWFFGHAWIEVDVYDAQGKVTGRLALNFAPESGKSDYQVMRPRNIVYPHLVGYDIKSSQFEDEQLVREWRRLQKDPTRGQRWNPIKNCIWRSVEYAHGEIPLTYEEAKKLLEKMPVRTDCYVTTPPPQPWYKEAYDWVGDTWGEFEGWLEDALN